MDMVESGTFPKNTLFCGDAGFVGYPLWPRLVDSGANFLVRVGANVSLLTEHAVCQFEKEGKNLFVYCWPNTAMQAGEKPLRLRLVQVHLAKIKVWMLTSGLDWQKLTPKAMVRFSTMKGRIEVELRGRQQTTE